MRLAVLACLVVLVAPACTSSSSPPPSPLTCASTVLSMCKAACMCGTGDAGQGCAIGTTVSDGALGGALSWPSATPCELYFAYLCADGGPPSFDFRLCADGLSTSSCVGTVNGRALSIPAACVVPIREAGAG